MLKLKDHILTGVWLATTAMLFGTAIAGPVLMLQLSPSAEAAKGFRKNIALTGLWVHQQLSINWLQLFLHYLPGRN